MRYLFAAIALLGFGYAFSQSVQSPGKVAEWAITNYPLEGAVVTPHDSTVLSPPRAIRANADGAVTAHCAGAATNATAITLTLVAGEFFPCQVTRVLDTGTDAITIHGFY